MQHSGQRDVVEIVPGRVGERSGLSPSSHPAVDESRIPFQALFWTNPEPFHDAGAESLEENIGAVDEGQEHCDVIR